MAFSATRSASANDLCMWLSYRCFTARGKERVSIFGDFGLANQLGVPSMLAHVGFFSAVDLSGRYLRSGFGPPGSNTKFGETLNLLASIGKSGCIWLGTWAAGHYSDRALLQWPRSLNVCYGIQRIGGLRTSHLSRLELWVRICKSTRRPIPGFSQRSSSRRTGFFGSPGFIRQITGRVSNIRCTRLFRLAGGPNQSAVRQRPANRHIDRQAPVRLRNGTGHLGHPRDTFF